MLDNGEKCGENMAILKVQIWRVYWRVYGENIHPRTERLAAIYVGFPASRPPALGGEAAAGLIAREDAEL